MVSPVLLTIWFIIIIYHVYKWMIYKPNNFPPGPPRIPILGAYPYMLLINYKHLHKAIDWLCKYYKSDVLGLYAGQFPTIVANTTETAKEILNNPKLDGKPAIMLAQLRDPDFMVRGIFFSEGQTWFEQRRFALRNLRDFGFGRRQDELEIELENETRNLIDLLKNGPKYDFEKKYHDGNSVLTPFIFTATFANYLMQIVLNDRLPRENHQILYDAATSGLLFIKTGDAWGRMFSYNSWIPKLFPKLSEFDVVRESAMDYYQRIKDIVDEQLRTFDPKHERHFLDMCFKKVEEEKDDPHSTHNYKQLIMMVADLFLPTFSSGPMQMQFLFQHFNLQPDIFKKCQNQIEKVVGCGRLPTLNDRPNLPYVEACIRESLRYYTLVPSGLPHTATANTTFRGYDIPKGAIIFSSLYGSHKDENTWNRPNQFIPERFLDESGKLCLKLDKSIPFGSGKRLCAGETFARNTMFLVLSAIIQNFDIAMPDDETMPLSCDNCTGLLHHTPEYRLRFLPR